MEHQHTNALIHEKSPYLLQHAHNPVDWLPWNEAAFARAREENKPIFLSIGYSTCHWCHVMERESFEDANIAASMNDNFINIKVDREERPDVDRVYMTFVQATNNGQGGWPMSVFLTPDLKPFFGGTYFPPRDAYGRPGFPSLCEHIADAWRNDRESIERSGTQVVEALQSIAQVEAPTGNVDWNAVLQGCYQQFLQQYDARWGGFGNAPKFPRPVTHDFLHRFHHLTQDEAALKMSTRTLQAMADGGMNDQLGGGFHRYSVDEVWIVSHFEKMLYDQSQLVLAYLEAFQLTGKQYFAHMAQSTLDYVLRDMTHGNAEARGAFYSAEDADSFAHESDAHKEEGAFYVWTQQELQSNLGAENAAIFAFRFGVQPKGNAPPQGDPHGEFKGKNILFLARSLEATADKCGKTSEETQILLQECAQQLFHVRNQRPRPHRDDKIIVAWNGLMISAFAQAGAILQNENYLKAAREAAHFIRAELFDAEQSTLRRHWKDGAADVAAFADDYAALSRGLIDLYEATGETAWLIWAEQLVETLNREFWDETEGGYFNSAPDPHVLIRTKEDYDGAEPSANSLATLNNLRLANLLERDDLRQKGEQTLQLFGTRLQQNPSSMPEMLCAQMMLQTPPQHIVIVGKPDDADTKVLLSAIWKTFAPFKNLILLSNQTRPFWEKHLPFVAAMQQIDGKATAYVCRNFACQKPTNNVEVLRRELER
jgi:uncharacterized protein YyaL (SSP411 family)